MTPTLAQRMEYYSLRGVVRGLGRLDWETACRIGENLGTIGYKPLRIRKDVVEKQIAAAFPEMTHAQVQTVARASFAHLGRTAIETALLQKESASAREILGTRAFHRASTNPAHATANTQCSSA